MVMIVETLSARDSSRGGACSVHGIDMVQQPATTAAGGCGERRRGSPRRLPLQYEWITYKSASANARGRAWLSFRVGRKSHDTLHSYSAGADAASLQRRSARVI